MNNGAESSILPNEYREILPAHCWPDVELRLKHIAAGDRPDALQEAVLAHLEGKSPALAVKRLGERERLHQQRETPLSQLVDETDPGAI